MGESRAAVSHVSAYAAAVKALLQDDRAVVHVDADLGPIWRRDDASLSEHARVLDVGIAEQLAVGVGAGLAAGGLKPIVATAASFLVRRALDQIFVSVAYSHLPVVMVGLYGGVFGTAGATHHCLNDFGILSMVPGIRCFSVARPSEVSQVLDMALATAPAYVRLERVEPWMFTDVPNAVAPVITGGCRLWRAPTTGLVVSYGAPVLQLLRLLSGASLSRCLGWGLVEVVEHGAGAGTFLAGLRTQFPLLRWLLVDHHSEMGSPLLALISPLGLQPDRVIRLGPGLEFGRSLCLRDAYREFELDWEAVEARIGPAASKL